MWFVFTFFSHHIVILIWQKGDKVSRERKIQIHRCTTVREHLSSSTQYLWTLNHPYRSALDLPTCMAFIPSLEKILPKRYHWLTIANMSDISDLTPDSALGRCTVSWVLYYILGSTAHFEGVKTLCYYE